MVLVSEAGCCLNLAAVVKSAGSSCPDTACVQARLRGSRLTSRNIARSATGAGKIIALQWIADTSANIFHCVVRFCILLNCQDESQSNQAKLFTSNR